MAPGGYTDTFAGWGSGAEDERGAANIPTWTGLNGQASRQEYRQGESSSSDSSNCVPILHK